MVDRAKTQYRSLTDGTSVVSKLVFKDSFEQDFLIARDKEYRSYLSVSSSFKQMADAEGLRIHFQPRPS
jgi:hypothetical protein